MKQGCKWLSGILFAVAAMILLSMTVQAAGKNMYCLYNSALKEYLYTIDENEKNNLLSTWEYKGVICTLPDSSSTPVYRLYDPASAQHLYTSDDAEINKLVGEGWKKEGVAYFVDDAHTAPVYRMFNPATGEHQFSGSVSNNEKLEATGWVKEGVAYYALSVEENIDTTVRTEAVKNNTSQVFNGAGVSINGVEITKGNVQALCDQTGLKKNVAKIGSGSNSLNWINYRFESFDIISLSYGFNSPSKVDGPDGFDLNYYPDENGALFPSMDYGVSFRGLKIGATRDEIKAAYGNPTKDIGEGSYYEYELSGVMVRFGFYQDRVREVSLGWK